MYGDSQGAIHFEVVGADGTQTQLAYSKHGKLSGIQELQTLTGKTGQPKKSEPKLGPEFHHSYGDAAGVKHTIHLSRLDHLLKASWITQKGEGQPSVHHFVDGKEVSDVETTSAPFPGGRQVQSLSYTHKDTGKHTVVRTGSRDGKTATTSEHMLNGETTHKYTYAGDRHGNHHMRHDEFITDDKGGKHHRTSMETNGQPRGRVITQNVGSDQQQTYLDDQDGKTIRKAHDHVPHTDYWENVKQTGPAKAQQQQPSR